jgi:hypothetical protein
MKPVLIYSGGLLELKRPDLRVLIRDAAGVSCAALSGLAQGATQGLDPVGSIDHAV